MDALFGSTDPGGYTGNAPRMTTGQESLLNQLTGMISGQVGKGVEAYPGQVVPGATGTQQNTFDLAQLITGGQYQPVQDSQGALSQMFQPFDPTSAQQYWQQGVVDPAMQLWERDILPAVQERFISNNAGSSGAANRAIARSGEELTTNLSGQLANLLYSGQQSHLGRQVDASNTLMNQLTGITGIGTTAGGAERDIMSQLLGEDYQKWLATQPYNNPWLNMVPQALGAQAFEPIVQGPSSSSGLLQSVIAPLIGSYMQGGGQGGIGGFFGSMFG
jgi:hypothetical protein